MSYDTTPVIASKIKPKNKQVEISLALDTDSESFDTSRFVRKYFI